MIDFLRYYGFTYILHFWIGTYFALKTYGVLFMLWLVCCCPILSKSELTVKIVQEFGVDRGCRCGTETLIYILKKKERKENDANDLLPSFFFSNNGNRN